MSAQLPLLDGPRQAEHLRLQEKREQLLTRIAKLRPHAHKRLELEIEVRQITRRQIELENELFGKGRRQ
ncbi:Hypothetical protein RG1141_CH23990 [Neorhizobium galegae bv. officinalis bv. officinalis str. HAMBI 1141]|uniref:Uncharacterized protein n=1 Tax=Neorhizobium galegae bv. officinalis bv. officinalis str. HAMBI 1141 TaxID=1028801 RepID=A0A068T883_NEOGA|nr:hypothetical protein [Neorhizobium galegae]CDN54737.1 Hypothetical protein RG1141_CH23990 [Neorhizobium galegae bv. officinalis bv. officinalis str. HAMBI 1141]